MKRFDGTKLRRAREAAGLSLEQLAQKVGDLIGARIAQQYISAWERGREPRAISFWALSRALEQPIDCFITDDGAAQFAGRLPLRQPRKKERVA